MKNVIKRTLPVISMLMLLLIVLVSWKLYQYETQKINNNLRKEVQDLGQSFEQTLLLNLESLNFLNISFHISPDMSAKEFKKLTHPILKTKSSIKALEWIPEVRYEDRQRYENSRSKVYPSFEITEKDKELQMVRAYKREKYFPVYYVEPYKGNEAALGFDLASSPKRFAALKMSAEENKLTLTASINLVQDKINQKGFLAFSPIYTNKSLKGFVLGVFRIEDLMKNTSQSLIKGLELRLLDITQSKSEILYESSTFENFEHTKDFEKEYKLVSLGGRQWKLVLHPNKYYIKKQRSFFPWVVLIFGIILIFSSSYFIMKQRLYSKLLLQRSEERFYLAMKGANDGLWDWDLLSSKIYYSPRWLSMLGYKEDECENTMTTLKDLCSEDDKDRVLNYIDKSLEDKLSQFEISFSMRHKQGGLINILSRARVIYNKDDEPIRIVGTHVDISEYKKLESQLRIALDTAQKASESKSSFLANMSHEIRTPMNAIIGFVENLSKQETNKDRLKKFAIIKESTNLLLSIINDILDLSKIESGKVQLDEHSFKVKELFENTAHIFQENAYKKGVVLGSIIEDNLPYALFGDSVKIRQVVSNLLSNAIKFTPNHKGVVLIVNYYPQEKRLEVKVKDEGIGIAEDKIESVFKHFEQEDNTTTRLYGGTGLGLCISSKLVEIMGGKLEVQSTLNEGSCFYFSLILQEVEEKLVLEEERENIDIDFTLPVLVAEDNKTNQLLICIILDEIGVTYDVADNGKIAVDLFSKNKYGLVLMDINMPELDGMEATQAIQEIEKERGLKKTAIIAVTANALIEDKLKFISKGMIDYVSKPYTENEIKRIVYKYYEGS